MKKTGYGVERASERDAERAAKERCEEEKSIVSTKTDAYAAPSVQPAKSAVKTDVYPGSSTSAKK